MWSNAKCGCVRRLCAATHVDSLRGMESPAEESIALPAPACAQHAPLPATAQCAECRVLCCELCARRAQDGRIFCLRCRPEWQYATPKERLLATLIDFAFSAGPAMVVGAMTLIFLATHGALAPGKKVNPFELPHFMVFFVIQFVVTFVTMIGAMVAQLWWLFTNGQTLGKRYTNIRVIKADGSRIDPLIIVFMRHIVPSLGTNVFGCIPIVGPLFALAIMLLDVLMVFRADHRTIHDLLAGTIVVKDPGNRMFQKEP